MGDSPRAVFVRLSPATALDDSTRRQQVVQYTSYADSADGVAGHGTHVAGSIVGESLSQEFSFANGVCSHCFVMLLNCCVFASKFVIYILMILEISFSNWYALMISC